MDGPDSPVRSIDAIDIVGVRKDGGIDTVIVCAGALDDSETTLESLRLKIRYYLSDIANESFAKQYGTGPVRIFVACEHEVSVQARQLIDDLAHEAARQRVLLVLGNPAT
jgi:hypothetical protein